MKKSSKIYLQQGEYNQDLYTVTKLVNRLVPKVGETLKQKDVEHLMRELEVTVEVTKKK